MQPMTMQGARNPQGGMSDVMFYVSGEGQPSHYGKSFDALADWVDHSLDMYRVGTVPLHPSMGSFHPLPRRFNHEPIFS